MRRRRPGISGEGPKAIAKERKNGGAGGRELSTIPPTIVFSAIGYATWQHVHWIATLTVVFSTSSNIYILDGTLGSLNPKHYVSEVT